MRNAIGLKYLVSRKKETNYEKEILFYDAYEAFYVMARKSNAFQAFARMLLEKIFHKMDLVT